MNKCPFCDLPLSDYRGGWKCENCGATGSD